MSPVQVSGLYAKYPPNENWKKIKFLQEMNVKGQGGVGTATLAKEDSDSFDGRDWGSAKGRAKRMKIEKDSRFSKKKFPYEPDVGGFMSSFVRGEVIQEKDLEGKPFSTHNNILKLKFQSFLVFFVVVRFFLKKHHRTTKNPEISVVKARFSLYGTALQSDLTALFLLKSGMPDADSVSQHYRRNVPSLVANIDSRGTTVAISETGILMRYAKGCSTPLRSATVRASKILHPNQLYLGSS